MSAISIWAGGRRGRWHGDRSCPGRGSCSGTSGGARSSWSTCRSSCWPWWPAGSARADLEGPGRPSLRHHRHHVVDPRHRAGAACSPSSKPRCTAGASSERRDGVHRRHRHPRPVRTTGAHRPASDARPPAVPRPAVQRCRGGHRVWRSSRLFGTFFLTTQYLQLVLGCSPPSSQPGHTPGVGDADDALHPGPPELGLPVRCRTGGGRRPDEHGASGSWCSLVCRPTAGLR